MLKSLSTWAAGYARALGTVLQSLWHSLGARTSLLFSLFFLLLLALLYFVGTESGRVLLTRGALYGAEKLVPELQVQAEDIHSEHLGAWQFARLRAEYRGALMVQAQDLALDIDIGGLLRKRINVELIGAAELTLDYDVLSELIEAQGQSAEAVVDEGDHQPLSLPQMRLGSLRIDRLQVIDQSLPDLPAFSIYSNGRYLWRDEAAQIHLEVRELDGADLNIVLDGREVEEQRFALDFSASEKPAGFAGSYLQLPEEQALDARGRILLWQPRENQLLLSIEEFSVPLVQHQFELSGRAAITLSPWKVATEGLVLRVDETRHEISGSVDGEQVDAEIKLKRLPIDISRPWQDFLRGGWLSADLSVSGPLSLPSASGLLDLSTSYRDEPLRLQARVNTREQVIHLQSATLEYAATRLDAEGSVDIAGESLDLRGQLQALALDDIRRLLAALPGTGEVEIPADLSGSVDKLEVAAKGPWSNPQLSAELQASPTYRNLEAQVRAQVDGDLKKLNIREILLEGDGLSVSGGGAVAIADESLQLKLQVDARNFRPADTLGLAAAEGAVVDMQAELGVAGPWANPQLDARIVSDGKYHAYRYALRGGAAGNLDRITLDKLRLELFADNGVRHFDPHPLHGPQSLILNKGYMEPGPVLDHTVPLPEGSSVVELARDAQRLGLVGTAWLELNGTVEPKAQRADVTVAGRNIPVSLAEVAGVTLPPSLEGQVSIEGRFSGPFRQPEASASLLALGEFRGEPWQLQGDVLYCGGRIDLSEVELVWSERNQLSVHGSLNEKLLDLEVRGRATLADLELPVPAEVAEQGEIVLSLSAAGSPQKPRLVGSVLLESRAPGLQGEQIQVKPLTMSLDWQTVGDNLQIALSASHGERRAIDARGQLAVTPILEQLFAQRPAGEEMPPLPLKLNGGGSADLSVLAEFIDPEIHAMRGQLVFDLSADGTVAQPNFNGRIELSGGDYEHRPSNTRLRRIEFLARLTPREWRIEKASARDGEKGRVELGGAVRFIPAQPAAMDFQLRADKLHLLNTPAVRGAVSGTLALTGTTEQSLVEGQLTLRPLAVQIEQLIGSSVPEIEVVEVEVDGPEVERAPPLLQSIALAIQVVLDQQSYVRGLGLDSELRGKVEIAGTAAKPQAAGKLEIVRGSFDLLGKKFTLQEGQVQFENNEAAIFVKGVHEYSEGEITAVISGTTDDLDVKFSSTPAAAQDEIFAQLLFGKSLSDISPLQAVRLVSVVRTLQSGGSVFDPVAKTRELLGVDTLDIEQEDTEDGDQYALSLGKYITNRIYIELQRSTDPLNPWQAKMQVELRRKLNLQIKSAEEGESGAGSVELQWKKDY